jgi:VanZ family protein
MKKKSTTFRKVMRFSSLWLPVVFWAVIIFSFSAHSTPSISEVHWKDFAFKKLVHVVEYGSFAALWFRAFLGSGFEKAKAFYYSLFLTVAYGASDEFHQSFTPGRDPTVRDMIIDSVGAFVFLYFIFKILPRMNERVVRLAGYFGFL